MTGELHTVAEAADILKVRESWLKTKASARLIPCTFVGKHCASATTTSWRSCESGHDSRSPPGGAAMAELSGGSDCRNPSHAAAERSGAAVAPA